MTSNLQRELDTIVEQLINNYKPQKIILFGSSARGETTEDSDFDFFIIKDHVPATGAQRCRELLQNIRYTRASDFLVYTPAEVQRRLSVNDPFVQDIMNHGKVLYG